MIGRYVQIRKRLSGFLCSGTMRPRTNRTISAGTSVTDSRAAAAIAKVFVKASGPNNRPSCDSSAWCVGWRAFQVLVGVLDHHDRRIDHRTDGNGDAAEAHDVGPDAERPHHRGGCGPPSRCAATATMQNCGSRVRSVWNF